MLRFLTALLVFVAMTNLTACASKSSCGDLQDRVRSMGDGSSNSQDQSQGLAKTDVLPTVAYADGSSTNSAHAQKVGVEVQSPVQAQSSPINIESPFGNTGGSIAAILSKTSPGEDATIKTLTRVQSQIEAINTRLSTDLALTAPERTELADKVTVLQQQEAALTQRLDDYTSKKMALAEKSAPNLPQFRAIVNNIIMQTTAGNEKPVISDAQAQSIARVAEQAVNAEPGANGNATAPAPK